MNFVMVIDSMLPKVKISKLVDFFVEGYAGEVFLSDAPYVGGHEKWNC